MNQALYVSAVINVSRCQLLVNRKAKDDGSLGQTWLHSR